MRWSFIEKPVPCFEEHISRAAFWLFRTWLKNEAGVGWSLYQGENLICEWGGTLEGIRALVRAGEGKHDLRIAEAVKWLRSVQQENGGWGSHEIPEACVEATAWVIITLRLCGEDSECIQKGVEFLVEAAEETNDNCRWGAYKGAEARIYPTLMAVWALNGVQEELSVKGANWLEASVNSDGGWGFLPKDGASNIAMTAMVLYVLLSCKHPCEAKTLKKAIEWIKSHRETDGSWGNVAEGDWICCIDPESGKTILTQTKHFSTAWAIMALIKAEKTVSDVELLESLNFLAEAQEEDGSWVFSHEDPKKYTWCTANGLWAMADARDAFYSPYGFTAYIKESVSRRYRWITYVTMINSFVLVLVVLYLSGAYQTILNGLKRLVEQSAPSIMRNIEVFAVSVAAAIAAIALDRRFGKK